MTESKSGEKTKAHIFFPNLDGLRFFSFFLVFLVHTRIAGIYSQYTHTDAWYIRIPSEILVRLSLNGDMGVSFFFTLSGFLITYLLLKEKAYTKHIHIKSFYIRRALRIWPLYYFCVFFGFVLFPVLKNAMGDVPAENADPILCSLFLNNFDIIKNGMPDSFVLQVLWSVAIEEQFYLVWPLLFLLIPERFYIWIMIVPIFISIIFRASHIGQEIDTHSLGVISDMAIGGMGAYFSIKKTAFLKALENANPALCLIPYLAVLLFMLFKAELFSSSTGIVLKRIAWSFFFIWIILEQNFGKKSVFKISSMKRISLLGKYTYGLYCLHTIAFIIVLNGLKKLHPGQSAWQLWLIEMPLIMILSLIFSYVSYTYFESKFLKLKDRFAFITKK